MEILLVAITIYCFYYYIAHFLLPILKLDCLFETYKHEVTKSSSRLAQNLDPAAAPAVVERAIATTAVVAAAVGEKTIVEATAVVAVIAVSAGRR